MAVHRTTGGELLGAGPFLDTRTGSQPGASGDAESRPGICLKLSDGSYTSPFAASMFVAADPA